MKKRRSELKNQDEDKILDVNASMQGTLRFDDPVHLRINGKFEGTLNTKGKLIIGQEANIKADITGEVICVAGNVNGNIKALKALKLEATARLDGDVETPVLAVDEGSVLNGQLKMTHQRKSDSASSGSGMTSHQLAEYLEVDTNKINEWAGNGQLPGTKERGEWMFEKSKVDQWVAEGKVRV